MFFAKNIDKVAGTVKAALFRNFLNRQICIRQKTAGFGNPDFPQMLGRRYLHDFPEKLLVEIGADKHLRSQLIQMRLRKSL